MRGEGDITTDTNQGNRCLGVWWTAVLREICVGLSFEVFISHGLGRGRLWITQYWLWCVSSHRSSETQPRSGLATSMSLGRAWIGVPIYEICAVSILPSIMSGIRKWKYPLLDHIASSHSQPGRSNVLGQHPVTEGFIEAQINKYHVIISSEGWGQSGAVITRVWGWLNWGCCSGKLIPHQLSAAILFHSQEE